uniref:Virion structural protein n=1 Tax=Salmonella phage vB_SEnST11_KE22 TaxID=3161173 RepID=A0AAU8GFE6_9CAUD
MLHLCIIEAIRDKMVVNNMIGGSMFQKLVREHPTLQEHWHTLLEKGFIENSKGCIALVRKYAADERVLIIRDAKNSILYTIRVGRLEVTRGVDSQNPMTYTFRVGDMGKLDTTDLEEAFDHYEGFESAIRDLYRTIDRVINEHKKSLGWGYRIKDWFRNPPNKIFFAVFIIYTIISILVYFYPLF